MDTPVFEEVVRGHTIKIYPDSDPENPRDWDNLGTLICGHSRYHLGDKHEFEGGRAFLLDLLNMPDDAPFGVDDLLPKAEKVAVILPVYLYDHSGLVMNTTGFHCPWDSGQVGFIYVTLENIRSEFNVQRVTAKRRDQVADHLRREVQTFSDYIGGAVYGFVIEDSDGEQIDSCWGYIGDYDGYCLTEARSCVPKSNDAKKADPPVQMGRLDLMMGAYERNCHRLSQIGADMRKRAEIQTLSDRPKSRHNGRHTANWTGADERHYLSLFRELENARQREIAALSAKLLRQRRAILSLIDKTRPNDLPDVKDLPHVHPGLWLARR